MNSYSFWANLFNPAGYMPRRICGIWTPGEIWLHNASDFFIWLAYIMIPIVLVRFAYAKRRELPFRHVFALFGMFIIACGSTHLMEIVMFYYPVYRLAGLIKFATAIISCATVAALVPVIPKALAMKSPEVLQREIEERERAEAEVRRLNAELEDRVRERTLQLEEANFAKDALLKSEQGLRLEAEGANRAKDEFLMTLSHELRTPLNAIQGWASLLESGQLDEATAKAAHETIQRNAQSQATLIGDILEVSRIITGKTVVDLRPLNPQPMIDAALSTVQPAAQAKGVELETNWEAGEVTIAADAERLQQVVWNLLSNALKFTPRGGKIEIRTRRNDSQLQIEVCDTGQGIQPEFLPYVFDRFRQADSSSTRIHGGLGLGLAIVRHITEAHGGTVRAHSEGAGKGATFTVSLPLRAVAHHETAIAPNGAADSSEKSLNGMRILVVDDESEARALVSTILGLHGAQTQTASSVREAMGKLLEWKPDVLVSDVGMPGEDGISFILRVRDLEGEIARIPALALTAYASPIDRERALRAGFGAHLSKPVMPNKLVKIVGQLRAKG